ncbi:11178_t:CDS:2, partial [Funneliformis caledonium]
MSEFCKCFICKAENSELGGKLVSINTFRRHRKKELNWSISINRQKIISLEDLEYFDDNNNLLEERNDDQDNFMDEMDGTQKYYYNNHDFNDSSNASVYLNDAKDDDNSNNLSEASVYINDAKDYDNSNDSNNTNYDDNSNVSSDASDAEFDELQYLYMQQELVQEYDNYDTPLGDLYESDLSENINNSESELNITDDLACALRLFEIKIQCNLTDNAFNQITKATSSNPISLYHIKTVLKKLVNIEPKWFDMCIHSCCACTGSFKNKIHCPYCNKPRYRKNNHRQQKKSRYQFTCFSLKEHLKIQYENPNRANELRYRHTYTSRSGFGED